VLLDERYCAPKDRLPAGLSPWIRDAVRMADAAPFAGTVRGFFDAHARGGVEAGAEAPAPRARSQHAAEAPAAGTA